MIHGPKWIEGDKFIGNRPALHIGHAKAISTTYGIAREFGGAYTLRFDDTNPVKEEQRYVEAIARDVRWLGFRGEGSSGDDPLAGTLFASDYFETMLGYAYELIDKGLAYVDEQTPEEIRAGRGDLRCRGVDSPYRDRSPGENRARFDEMVAGKVGDGERVLRAKIDMASGNMNLRDPVMYRVLNTPHHRQGSKWHVYPMYDWAHGIEDSIEGITHSLCSLEFQDHRPLYDWFIEAINRGRDEPIHHPQQIEFARLNPTYVVTSKRFLRRLVEEGRVDGWDDPRMPTISGMRRRGYTPESVLDFCTGVGVTKFPASHDIGLLENAVRADLNVRASRRMCVTDPLKVTITNWGDHGDADRVEMMRAINNPEDEGAGSRDVPFSGTLYIERDDFMEEAPKKFFRLKPGGEVRLRYGYWIACHGVVKDDDGNVVELLCTYDPETRGGDAPPPDAEGKVRKVKGTLHWVSAPHAVRCTVREFDRLFTAEQPGKGGDLLDDLNPDALRVIEGAMLEPNWSTAPGSDGQASWPDGIERVQFERKGYFCVDALSTPERLVWNRTVSLKDSWAKQAKKG
ncbi:MAG: glutamine--tRNA ligase [Planctomycetota bacterium]